ncbi:MAG: CPBP family intramembrane glutamic endopeptidase [Chloroflexota bacterium]
MSTQASLAVQWSPATRVGLFVALVLTAATSWLLGPAMDPSRGTFAMAMEWILTIGLLMLVLFWERKPLESIGWRKMSWGDLLWALVAFLVGIVAFAITTPIVSALGLGGTGSGIEQLARIPIGWRVALPLTAGITEEILFRGYPIERLNALTGRIGLGAAIAYAMFVMLHVPFWGLGGAIQIGVWSVVVTLLYVWRRNLPACILMHILNDGYAFVLVPALFAP